MRFALAPGRGSWRFLPLLALGLHRCWQRLVQSSGCLTASCPQLRVFCLLWVLASIRFVPFPPPVPCHVSFYCLLPSISSQEHPMQPNPPHHGGSLSSPNRPESSSAESFALPVQPHLGMYSTDCTSVGCSQSSQPDVQSVSGAGIAVTVTLSLAPSCFSVWNALQYNEARADVHWWGQVASLHGLLLCEYILGCQRPFWNSTLHFQVSN